MNYKEIEYLQNRDTFLWNFVPNSGLEKVRPATVASVVNSPPSTVASSSTFV